MISEITLGALDEMPAYAPGSDFERAKRAGLNLEPMAGANFVMETVQRINAAPVEELQSKLPAFIERREQNAFVLGAILERIRREKFWNVGSRRPHNALFERWVENTCHYSGRKARYLISVYLGVVQAAIPTSKVLDIGWSKLRMIAPLLRPVGGDDADRARDNAAHNDRLIKLARRKSRKGLEATLRSMAADTSRGLPAAHANPHKPRRLVFAVNDGDAHIVTDALEAVGKETGKTGAAALVDMASIVAAPERAPSLEYLMRKAGKELSLSTFNKVFGTSADAEHPSQV